MYSWKITRIACILLLLLPIVHLAYLMSRDARETLNNSPEAWSREINDYASVDTATALPKNPIVVVGGRRVKLWDNLQELLAPRPVVMRGLGDAIVEDITHYHAQLIGHYQPEIVVLVPGNSEFHVRDNKSAKQLTAAIRELVELDTAYGVTKEYYIFAPLKTLLRPQDHAKMDDSAHLLKAWAAADEQIEILDANPLLSGPDGLPMARYFRGDGVNLNEHGYLRLSVLLLSQLETDEIAQAELPEGA